MSVISNARNTALQEVTLQFHFGSGKCSPGASSWRDCIIPCSGYSKVQISGVSTVSQSGNTASTTITARTLNVNGATTLNVGRVTVTSTGSLEGIAEVTFTAKFIP